MFLISFTWKQLRYVPAIISKTATALCALLLQLQQSATVAIIKLMRPHANPIEYKAWAAWIHTAMINKNRLDMKIGSDKDKYFQIIEKTTSPFL